MNGKEKTLKLNKTLNRIVEGVVYDSDNNKTYTHSKDCLKKKYCLSHESICSIYKFAHSCLEGVEDEKTITKIITSLVCQKPKIIQCSTYIGKDIDGDNLFCGDKIFHENFGDGVVDIGKIVFVNTDVELALTKNNLKKIKGTNPKKHYF